MPPHQPNASLTTFVKLIHHEQALQYTLLIFRKPMQSIHGLERTGPHAGRLPYSMSALTAAHFTIFGTFQRTGNCLLLELLVLGGFGERGLALQAGFVHRKLYRTAGSLRP